MKNERTANEAIADYNQKEWEQRQAWAKVLGSSTERNSKLAAPVKPCRYSHRANYVRSIFG